MGFSGPPPSEPDELPLEPQTYSKSSGWAVVCPIHEVTQNRHNIKRRSGEAGKRGSREAGKFWSFHNLVNF